MKGLIRFTFNVKLMTIGERPTKNNIESLDLTRKTFSVFDVENRLGAPFLKDI